MQSRPRSGRIGILRSVLTNKSEDVRLVVGLKIYKKWHMSVCTERQFSGKKKKKGETESIEIF